MILDRNGNEIRVGDVVFYYCPEFHGAELLTITLVDGRCVWLNAYETGVAPIGMVTGSFVQNKPTAKYEKLWSTRHAN
jgi:hypothetical protein